MLGFLLLPGQTRTKELGRHTEIKRKEIPFPANIYLHLDVKAWRCKTWRRTPDEELYSSNCSMSCFARTLTTAVNLCENLIFFSSRHIEYEQNSKIWYKPKHTGLGITKHCSCYNWWQAYNDFVRSAGQKNLPFKYKTSRTDTNMKCSVFAIQGEICDCISLQRE